MRLTTISLVGLFLFAVTTTGFAQGPIAWMRDIDGAKQIAKRDRRLVLVHFYADWCGPCRTLDRAVFPHPDVARAIEANYVPVKIDVDRNQALAKRYGVSQIPADVILDAQGRVLFQAKSPTDPSQYTQLLSNLVSSGRSPSSVYAASGRMPQQGQQTSWPPQDRWDASLQGRSANGGVAGQSSTNPTAGAGYDARAAWPSNNRGETTGYFMDSRQNPWSRSGVDYINNPATGEPTATAANVASPSWYAEKMTPAARQSTGSSIVNPHVTMPNDVPKPPTPQQPPAEALAPNAPLALDGYCPVSLAEGERWSKGDVMWGARHRGRTYLFASQQQKQRFMADPDRYSPVLSGYDPTRYVDSGELVPGQRRHGMWFRGKIYLFTDEDSLQRFSLRPEHYAQKAYEIMMTAGR